MQFRALLLASVLLPAGASFAQDPPVPCTAAGPGGTLLDELGVCDGTDAIFCGADGNVVRIPCAALFDGAPVGSCEVYADFGSYCAFNDGDACGFQTQDGTNQFFACATDTSGCVDGVCTANVGACTPDAPPSCLDGTTVNTQCAPWAQSIALGCGGTLTCAGAGVCEGAASGAQCADGIVECAPPLTCNGATADAPGTCGTAGGEGEGEGEGEAEGGGGRRDDNAEPAPSGCPFNAAGSFPAFGALALLVVGLRRRR